MNDLISRQDAIDAICGECQGNCIPCKHYPCGEIKALEQLPPARSEQKIGKWNIIRGNIVVCSECGMYAPETMTGCLLNRHLEPNRTNFCPNCGVKMKEE